MQPDEALVGNRVACAGSTDPGHEAANQDPAQDHAHFNETLAGRAAASRLEGIALPRRVVHLQKGSADAAPECTQGQ
jgi:hypothetical protein